MIKEYWCIDYLDDGIWTAYDEFWEHDFLHQDDAEQEAFKIAQDCTNFGDGIARYYKGHDGQFGADIQCIVYRDGKNSEKWLYSKEEVIRIFGGKPNMELYKPKYAELTAEQMQMINEMEKQLGVSLVAYEGYTVEDEQGNPIE